jgi:hypothetical protein
MNARIDGLVERAASQEEQQRQSHSDLRSSNSSILALSKSHDKRLRELQSVSSQLSEKVDMLLRALSSHGSQTSSVTPDHCPMRGTTLDPADGCGDESNRVTSTTTKLATCEPTETKEDEARPKPPGEDFAEDGDLSALFRLLDDFHLLAGQYFDGIIAEYVIAAEEWRAVCIRGSLLGLVERNENAPRMMFDGSIPSNTSRSAAKLLLLRRRAIAEGLSESLAEADKLLGLTQSHFSQWEALSAQYTKDNGGKTLVFADRTPHVNATESLARMNEWLLTVMYSTPYLAEFHRPLTSSLLARFNESTSDIKGFSRVDRDEYDLMKRDEWQRLTLKLWMFDGVGLEVPGGYAASTFTDSRESEMTIMAYDSGEAGGIHWADFDEDTMVLLQPLVDDRQLRGLKQVNFITELNLPPSGATQRHMECAAEALKSYIEEPFEVS